MFGGRLDLLFYNKEPIFYNSATRMSLENTLHRYNERLSSKEVPEVERTQLRRAKEEAERTLKQLRSKNQFTNQIISLHEQMEDDPDIGKMIEAFKAKTQTKGNPVSPKS
jgi:phosphoenolpyruvate-protein kinase (PTS system EI component)